ncbi:MAG: hypothetical protein CMM01_00875 [Rhodopirellula sp.]|nr:hypothetical protein [Rhodopirellula sp.]OUX52640.1 MAG: hypothetical protein CBE43_00240 [Rhodopirellula sp. TMED283]
MGAIKAVIHAMLTGNGHGTCAGADGRQAVQNTSRFKGRLVVVLVDGVMARANPRVDWIVATMLWKREHMQVPRKQHRKRRFLGGSENGCVRHRARYKNHVWSYDFVTDRTEDGRQLRLLVVIDEFTRECLAIEVGRSFTAQDVMGVLQYLFAVRGNPEHIRSDNLGNDTGPEFVSRVICRWLKQADVKTLFIAKGSPWENGYVESFNGTLRDELLNREIFLGFEEACWVIDRWRLDYNHHRIHSSLDDQTPAAYAAGCALLASATPQPPEHSRFTNPNPLTQPGAKTGG